MLSYESWVTGCLSSSRLRHIIQWINLHSNTTCQGQPVTLKTDSVPSDESAPVSVFEFFSRLCFDKEKKNSPILAKIGQRCDTGIWIECHQILILITLVRTTSPKPSELRTTQIGQLLPQDFDLHSMGKKNETRDSHGWHWSWIATCKSYGLAYDYKHET